MFLYPSSVFHNKSCIRNRCIHAWKVLSFFMKASLIHPQSRRTLCVPLELTFLFCRLSNQSLKKEHHDSTLWLNFQRWQFFQSQQGMQNKIISTGSCPWIPVWKNRWCPVLLVNTIICGSKQSAALHAQQPSLIWQPDMDNGWPLIIKQAASVRQRLKTTRYHLDSGHLTRPFNRDWFIYLLGFIGREDISVRLDNKPWGRCRGLLCVCVVSSLEDLNVCEGLFAWTWKASFRCSFQGHTQRRLCKHTPKQPYKWELEKHICDTILVRNFSTIFKFNQIVTLIVILALKSVNTLNQA